MENSIITEELIKKALKKQGTIKDLKIKNLCGDAEAFTANLFEVAFKFSNKETKETQYNFVVKYPNEESFMYQSMKMMDGYKKEALMFNKLIPDAINWQRKCFGNVKYPVPAPELFYCDEENDILIMENLKESNYNVEPRQIEKNLEQSKTVMRSIAEFHAIMLAYFQSFQKAEDFFKLYPFARNTDKTVFQNMMEGPDALEQKEKVFNPLITALKTAVPEKKELFDKYSKHALANAVAKNVYMCVLPNEEFNVICHGDLWNNNVMFSKNPSKNCKFIDFQLFNYCSPAVDVSNFLWLSASADLLRTHLQELLKTYYDVFKNSMTDMKSVVKFSFEDFFKHVKKLYDVGLEYAISSAAIMFAPEDNAININVKDADENPMAELANQMEKLLEKVDKKTLQRVISLIEIGEHFEIF